MHPGPELANVECVPYVNRQVIRLAFWCVKLQRLHFGRRILARTIGQRLQAVAWLEIDDRHKSVLRRNVERMTRRDQEDIFFCLAFELEAADWLVAANVRDQDLGGKRSATAFRLFRSPVRSSRQP